MHVPDRRQESGVELKSLLGRGISTGTWSFAQNLARVIAEQSPRAELLAVASEALARGDDTALRRFPEWEGLPHA